MQNDSGLQPMEYNVVIRMDPVQDKSAGGIFLPETKKDRDELACDEGTLVAVSPLAFNYGDWPGGEVPARIGDRVLFSQYSGRIWEREGVKYRLLKDKEVIGVVERGVKLEAVA